MALGVDFYSYMAGRLMLYRFRNLKNLIKAIGGITDLDIRLIYTPYPPRYISALGINSSKLIVSMASPSDMPRLQSRADILFLLLSWHTEYPDLINPAISEKLTDYLIARRPILVHTPSKSYLVKYTKANWFAEVADEESIPAFRLLSSDY